MNPEDDLPFEVFCRFKRRTLHRLDELQMLGATKIDAQIALVPADPADMERQSNRALNDLRAIGINEAKVDAASGVNVLSIVADSAEQIKQFAHWDEVDKVQEVRLHGANNYERHINSSNRPETRLSKWEGDDVLSHGWEDGTIKRQR